MLCRRGEWVFRMLCFVFAALVVLLDQFFKNWIVRSLDLLVENGDATMELIPGVIDLVHIQNTGAAFSILADQRWLLAGIAFVACVALVFILLRYTEGFWGTLGLAAVLGGTVGNLIDRVMYGHVVDMFRTLFVNFAIFNIADIFITLGFTTFCIHFVASSIRAARLEKQAFEDAHVGEDEYDDEYDGDYDDEYEDEYDDEPEDEQEDIFGTHDDNVVPDFDDFSDTRVIPSAHSEARHTMHSDYVQQPEPEQTAYINVSPVKAPAEPSPSSWKDYYEEPVGPSGSTSTLDALSALEAELGSVADYDVDALLREYGFEDD